ncbi:MAG: hypothetical protein FJ190_06740 [Gammaproteobacteria bacterium]|nr:hypothetical protein [Gammaproteobacteria bacterium]
MNGKRALPVFCLIGASFILTGFKQSTAKLPGMSKTQAAEAENHPKKLDLSVPRRDISFQEAPALVATAQSALSDINKTIKNNGLELQGNVIMSQEPEVGKTRSADGAGILINLHH